MIEWRGDRYVRASSSQPASPDYAGPAGQMTRRTQAQRLPAVLVFRNGSRVEVDNYTIVGDFLYTNADRWVTGAWNKRIDLATLDIPSTLQANQQRGVAFNLPSSPNEVMVRP
jgi:hypothetical protein